MRTASLAFALALAAPVPAPATDVPAASRIDAVTVYRGSARVTRLARTDVPAGDARVLLAGLPDELLDDSVRVEGHGMARARVFGVSVERIIRAEAAAGEFRAAEVRLEKLQEEDRGLEDRGRVAQGRQKFVESLRSTYAEERAKNLAVRGVSAREWADLAGFVESQLAGAAAEIRRAEAARRELARRIQQAREELDRLAAKRSQTTKTVAVELQAERPGAVELRLSYTVPSASWQPVWDARLSPESAQVELALIGSVSNRSGEDWKEVRLAVSTAAPSRGLFVPQLEPRYLARKEPVLARVARPAAAPPTGKLGVVGAAEEAAAEAAPAKLAAIEEGRAEVQEGLLAATFTSPRRETVDGSGEARRVPLSRFALTARVERTAAPRIDPAAFLVARMTNETGVPLLAGTAGVYLGDEFVGRAPLSATPPGGELALAFGADPRVEVERRVLERRRETAGIVSKDDVWRYRTRIAVKNRWAVPVQVKLLDLVPVSLDEAIVVKVQDGTAPAAADPERPGVRIHDLALGPKEERVVEIRYTVRHPRGLAVAGLE